MKTGYLIFVNNQWMISHLELVGNNSFLEKLILINPQDVTKEFSEGKRLKFEYSENKIKYFEFLDESFPVISDNFQIGPDGAYEYGEEEVTWEDVFNELEEMVHEKLPMRVKNWFQNKFEPPVLKIQK